MPYYSLQNDGARMGSGNGFLPMLMLKPYTEIIRPSNVILSSSACFHMFLNTM